ncbi:MAG TPA: winged helix-turn-helix domain-containing protein [Candidatus Limnocylindrales bacterium]|jgi:DNA-binding transcriptional ArsR family regulator
MPRRNGTGIALLADPTRRQIIALLAVAPQQPSELARHLTLSRPAVTRQLRLLEDADLVVAHQRLIDRRAVLYTLNARRHGAITAWLAGTDVGRSFLDPTAAAGIPAASTAVDDIPADRFRGRSQQAEPSED